MAYTTSPNMQLTIPNVGTESGPQYAFDVNTALSLVDSHDHTPGKGVQITPAGMNINATLTFNDNMLSNVMAVVFQSQSTAPGVAQSLYVQPGTEPSPGPYADLWYYDGVNPAVQITANGEVNATIASIPGESYGGGTFTWRQGTGSSTPANFDIGSITIRPTISGTSAGVTLNASNTGAYPINFPGALPSSQSFATVDNSGNLTFGISTANGITASNIANGTITSAQISGTAGITGSQLANGTVTGTQIATDTVSQSNLVIKTASQSASAGNVAISSTSGTLTETASNGGTGTTTNSKSATTTQTTTITAASPAVFGVASTASLYVGEPVVFTGGGIAGTSLTPGATYYISNIINSTTFNVSSAVYGTNVNNTGTPASGVTSTFTTLSVAITTLGGPVQLSFIPDGTSSGAYIPSSVLVNIFYPPSFGSGLASVSIYRNGTLISTANSISFSTTSTDSFSNDNMPGGISFIDTPPAGNYSYTVQITASATAAATVNTSTSISLVNCELIAYEL